ncbi:LytR/AlgR family response regulator transcription factor [Hymenobacter jejuensis]|uniref:Response regulator transcription factor n=1 Tax=Hymenobacter jejuensis TaxID=2502781 RepID=A0A5B7ZV64_9BACT|nr:LytTR family DNA-binding domain-containing protein [Hymenobacter jejuensis]QDA58679.1 response regulator transcription factor [Hymenobacter jejuensis]
MPLRYPEAPLRCVVLEDDLLVRELVGSFVEQIPSLQLTGLYEDAMLAFEHLAQQPTELLISDIEMPRLNGLELVRSLRQPPLVIFMTSHRQYAAQTYELDAVDYLVKPLTFERFLRAVDKAQLMVSARRQWQQGAAGSGTTAPSDSEAQPLEVAEDYFFIRTEFQFVKLRYADVVYVEAMRDFTKIHLLDGTVHITLVNLKNIEEQLPKNLFVRTHRSFLVNASKIEVVTNQDVKVNKMSVPLGLTFRDVVTERVVQQRLITRKP